MCIIIYLNKRKYFNTPSKFNISVLELPGLLVFVLDVQQFYKPENVSSQGSSYNLKYKILICIYYIN